MDLSTVFSRAEILCKLGVAAHTFNLYSWEAQAGGLGVWGHLQLHSDVEASLGYLRPHLNELKSQRCVVYLWASVLLFKWAKESEEGGMESCALFHAFSAV